MGVNVSDASPTAPAEVDWEQVREWDARYVLHNLQAESEYTFDAVDHAEGNWLYLSDGSRLLDFQSQLISDSMGHRHPHVVEALREALERYGHVAYNFTTDYLAQASKMIVEDLLGPDDWAARFRILPSGTDSVETAMLMARMYTQRPVVLTQGFAYHGFTPAAGTTLRGYSCQLSPQQGGEVRDVPELGAHRDLVKIPPPEPEDFEASGTLPSLEATAQIIEAVGPSRIAAVITETMFGAGGWRGHEDYLRGLRELTERHGILWIDDEVVCGFGRMGKWFSYQLYEGLRPDLMTVGKGMNGCIIPSGGVVSNLPISDFFNKGRWYHGSTHEGHPLVAATIVANIEAMIAEDIPESVVKKGEVLRTGLEQLRRNHKTVGRIHGAGLLYAVDLVDADGLPIVRSDRAFDWAGDLSGVPAKVIQTEAAKHEVYLGGIMPNTIKCAPPLTVTEDEIALALEAFDAGLERLDASYA